MASTNFKIFNEDLSPDRTFSDAEYNVATQRQGGVIPGMALSRLHNKLYRQSSSMAKAIADFLVAQGIDCMDNDVPGITAGIRSAILNAAGSEVKNHNTSLTAHADLLHLRQNSKAYAINDIAYSSKLQSYAYAECIQAGTTAATEPTWPTVGNTVTDGTVKWVVRDIRDARKFFDGKTSADFAPTGSGLGVSAADISSSASLNSFPVASGFYKGSSITNAPTTNYGYLYTAYGLNSVNYSQLFHDAQNGKLYERSAYGTHRAWNQIITSDQVKVAVNLSDLNTITTSGFYRVGAVNANLPPGRADGQLLVMYGGGDTITQVYGDYSGNNLYFRSGNPSNIGGSGSWGNWKQVATTDIAAPAGCGTGGFLASIDNQDVNTVKTNSGTFYCISCTNLPVAKDGYLKNDIRNANYIHQTFTAADGVGSWDRICMTGVWSAWKQIATTDQVPSVKSEVASSTADLNTIITSGFYRLGNGNSNLPDPSCAYGQLLVMRGGGATIAQICVNYSKNIWYARSGSPTDVGGTGTWTEWKRIDQSGVQIGTIMPFLATKAQPGWLACDTGALVSRTTYPDLWAWVQANAPLITESAWQAQAAVQSSVGYYSSGDGSTTFRLPRIVDFVSGTDVNRPVGTWRPDEFKSHSHVGTRLGSDQPHAGSSYLYSQSDGSKTTGETGGNETRPKSISMLYCVKAFDSPTNQGMIDITALANNVAGKVNLTDFTGNQSKTANGWQKLPGGLILQWGTVSGYSSYTVNFPIAFPNAVFQVVANTDNPTTGTNGHFVEVASLTKSSFVAYCFINNTTLDPRAIRYIAVGY